MTAGDEACEKEGGAHGLAAAGDHGFALRLSGLAGKRGKPGEACDPLAVEGSEFGQFGDERAGGDRPHTRNGGEEVLLPRAMRAIRARPSVDFRINPGQLLLERGDQASELLRIRLTATRFSRFRSATIIS